MKLIFFALPLIFPLVFLAACQTPKVSEAPVTPKEPTAEKFELVEMPDIGAGLKLGAFSGLAFEGRDEKTGALKFITHTDRGPNKEPVETKGGEVRPFALPDFHPQWIRFTLLNGVAKVQQQIVLKDTNGRALTGLPNQKGDEVPVDLKMKKLKLDPHGLDLESIARDADGTFWMGEEYRPSILHFDASGKLISRWIPKGDSAKIGQGLLPDYYKKRQPNRGFEALAVSGQHVYAFLQTGFKDDKGVTRILKVEKATGKPVGEYLYAFEPASESYKKVDKIGDAVAVESTTGGERFFVLEQNGANDARAFRRVYEIDLSKAANVLGAKVGPESAPVSKQQIADLTSLGFREQDKAEGLTRVDDHTIAVVNDNDFAVNDPNAKTYLLLIHLP